MYKSGRERRRAFGSSRSVAADAVYLRLRCRRTRRGGLGAQGRGSQRTRPPARHWHCRQRPPGTRCPWAKERPWNRQSVGGGARRARARPASAVALTVALAGHSKRGQQKPCKAVWRQPGTGGGQDCCRHSTSPRKQKQKSHACGRGTCSADW